VVLGLASLVLFTGLPATAPAQQAPSADQPRGQLLAALCLGFGASILAHESAHILSSLAMGFHPYIAFDKGRPTVYSGIDSDKHPDKQFIFSAAGLTTQALINEAILDIRTPAAARSSGESSPAESARPCSTSPSAATHRSAISLHGADVSLSKTSSP